MKKLIYLWALSIIFVACKPKTTIIEEETASVPAESQAPITNKPQDLHEVVVKDIHHTSKYSYLQVLEGTKSVCVAIPLDKTILIDRTYYFKGGIIMANPEILPFKEKFESVMIAPGLSDNPLTVQSSQTPSATSSQGNPSDIAIKEVNIVTAPGVIKLSDLFKEPSKFEGKVIKVQGQCVKVNRMILNKNWLHIQDHSKNKQGQPYDLTITTLDETQLGDVVVFEGKLSLNKDFGSGYKYDVILEEAKLK